MPESDATIWIRLRGKAREQVDMLLARFERGKATVAGWGAVAANALGRVATRARAANVAVKALWRTMEWGARGASRIVGYVTTRLRTLAHWAGLAAVAFAGMQIRGGLSFLKEMEQYAMTLSVVTKSQAYANRLIQWVYEYSMRTPFQFPDLAAQATNLEVIGLSAKRWLPVVSDLAAAFRFDPRAPEAIRSGFQYLMAGSPMAFRLLRRFGLTHAALMAEGVKFSRGGQLVSGISETFDAIERIVEKRFGGMVKRQSRTFGGLVSTVRDNLWALRAELTKPLFGELKADMESFLSSMGAFGGKVTKRQQMTAIATAIGERVKAGYQGIRDYAVKAFDLKATDKPRELVDKIIKGLADLVTKAFEKLAEIAARAFVRALGPALKGAWKAGPWSKAFLGLVGGLTGFRLGKGLFTAGKFLAGPLAGAAGGAAIAGEGAAATAGMGALAKATLAAEASAASAAANASILARLAALGPYAGIAAASLGAGVGGYFLGETLYGKRAARRKAGRQGWQQVSDVTGGAIGGEKQYGQYTEAQRRQHQRITAELARQAGILQDLVNEGRERLNNLVRTRDVIASAAELSRATISDASTALEYSIADEAGKLAILEEQLSEQEAVLRARDAEVRTEENLRTLYESSLTALEKQADLRLKILELTHSQALAAREAADAERKAAEAARDAAQKANQTAAEQWARMNPAERARTLGMQGLLERAAPEALLRMPGMLEQLLSNPLLAAQARERLGPAMEAGLPAAFRTPVPGVPPAPAEIPSPRPEIEKIRTDYEAATQGLEKRLEREAGILARSIRLAIGEEALQKLEVDLKSKIDIAITLSEKEIDEALAPLFEEMGDKLYEAIVRRMDRTYHDWANASYENAEVSAGGW